jgi:hypothetical protein
VLDAKAEDDRHPLGAQPGNVVRQLSRLPEMARDYRWG